MGSTSIGPMRIGDGGGWTFLNGAWEDGPDGEFGPPDGTRVEYLAIREQEAFEDFAASFRFRLRNITPVRFLFRLQDSRRFYALDIPFGGQQFRSRACWAGMVIADGTPLQRYLNSGEVTLYLTYGNPNAGERRRAVFIRSQDKGRTWGPPEPATLDVGFGGPFVRRDGTWVCLHANPDDAAASLVAYESGDEGRTWRGPEALQIAGGWPSEWRAGGPWRAVRMRDGALVAPVMVSPADEPQAPTQCPFWAAMVIRSEDDGHSWSVPVLCDADAREPGQPPSMLRYAARYYEVAMDEAEPGVLVGIGRPDRDPYMWQLRSEDGGRTWEPAAIGHFPGFCPSLTRTASGALVATTRYPHFAAHLSRDNGRTWSQPIIIDYAIWANQQAVEIEPDVVLLTYMGHIMDPGQPDSRIARLRVTDRGLMLDH